MFDSQNNNRGGYNKGDVGTDAFVDESGQYDFFYYMSHKDHLQTGKGKSILEISWTNQVSCSVIPCFWLPALPINRA